MPQNKTRCCCAGATRNQAKMRAMATMLSNESEVLHHVTGQELQAGLGAAPQGQRAGQAHGEQEPQ